MYKELDDEEKKKTNGKGGSSFDWIKSLVPRIGRRGLTNSDESGTASNPPRSRYGAPTTPEWLTEMEAELNDPDLETTLKTDLFNHRVFVFTPTGDVVDLPVHSSPIDFAYAIHSDIGNHVFAAKVNSKMVSLDTPLHNGDIVEIVTKKTASPKAKWLDFAKTTMARRHIRIALEKEHGATTPNVRGRSK